MRGVGEFLSARIFLLLRQSLATGFRNLPLVEVSLPRSSKGDVTILNWKDSDQHPSPNGPPLSCRIFFFSETQWKTTWCSAAGSDLNRSHTLPCGVHGVRYYCVRNMYVDLAAIRRNSTCARWVERLMLIKPEKQFSRSDHLTICFGWRRRGWRCKVSCKFDCP